MASRKTTGTRVSAKKSAGGEAAARTQRALQDEIESKDARSAKGKDDGK